MRSPWREPCAALCCALLSSIISRSPFSLTRDQRRPLSSVRIRPGTRAVLCLRLRELVLLGLALGRLLLLSCLRSLQLRAPWSTEGAGGQGSQAPAPRRPTSRLVRDRCRGASGAAGCPVGVPPGGGRSLYCTSPPRPATSIAPGRRVAAHHRRQPNDAGSAEGRVHRSSPSLNGSPLAPMRHSANGGRRPVPLPGAWSVGHRRIVFRLEPAPCAF